MPIRALPTISDPSQQMDLGKTQQVTLQPTVSLPTTPVAPWNFSGTSQRGGVSLSWSPLTPSSNVATSPSSQAPQPADGYELQRSATGDFSPGKFTSIALRDPNQKTYFDSLGGASQTMYYRLRATNGTLSNPYSVHGLFTGIVKVTSIDATDTMTSPATTLDTFTSQKTQSRAGNWKSGTNYPSQR